MTQTQVALAETFTAMEPRRGVYVVDGYGLQIHVERRHLVVRDGIGRHRRERRFARVGHGLTRLVVLGRSGTVSLESFRWLDRLGIQFLHLDRDGISLTGSAHAGLDDARLRRAQALAGTSDLGRLITIQLLDAKLTGQARLTAAALHDDATASRIEQFRKDLPSASLIEARELEALAATAYFAAWRGRVALRWATKDQLQLPEHWTRFDARRSPLRRKLATIRAADPINAILNYLYALAEAECRFACLILGLDPGLGLLHADAKSRDSLALDLIEVIRPDVDAFVLDLATTHIFRRADFVEHDDGHCRVLAPLTHRLAETLPQWRQAIAPWTEYVAHQLIDASPHPIHKATPLTATNRRPLPTKAPRRKTHQSAPTRSGSPLKRSPLGRACIDCGAQIISNEALYCLRCRPARRAAALQAARATARKSIRSNDGKAARGAAVALGRRLGQERRAREYGWDPEVWKRDLAPHLGRLTLKQLVSATQLSETHVYRVKRGVHVPHPKHWQAVADLLSTPTPDL